VSNILILLLWLSEGAIADDIKKRAAYVGTAYTADAVNYVVKALYERLNYVDTVVVYGPDFTGAGELIVQTLRGACTEAVRVPCHYVEGLNVAVVDLRWRSEQDLRRAVEEAYKPREAPARPNAAIEIQRPEKRLPYLGLHVLYDTDLEALRVKAIHYILTYGVESRDALYNVLALHSGHGGVYLAAPCDVVEEWPCGLGKHDVLIAAPAYIQKRHLGQALAAARLDVYKRDVYDPHGNFVLSPDALRHYDARGVLLREVELSDEAVKREAAMLHPDHAFYLGQEYAAYKLLKDRYVQDRWKH